MNEPDLRDASSSRQPTSAVLDRLLHDAPDDTVTLAWIVERLGERSFGIVMLVLALVGLVPGVSTIVGVLLAVPAVQMMLGRAEPAMPGWIARRRLSAARLRWLLRRVNPVLRWLERLVRPRWRTPFQSTKRVLGAAMLLLGATVVAPIPFGHVIPILAIALLAFAFLEKDGILLALALALAAISLAITAAAVWGAIEAGRLL